MEEKENGVTMEASRWETPLIQVISVSNVTMGGSNAGDDYLEQS
jgi:hypothetical protein